MKKSRFFYLFSALVLLGSLGFWVADYLQHGDEMDATEHIAYAAWCAFLLVAALVSYAVDKRRGTV